MVHELDGFTYLHDIRHLGQLQADISHTELPMNRRRLESERFRFREHLYKIVLGGFDEEFQVVPSDILFLIEVCITVWDVL